MTFRATRAFARTDDGQVFTTTAPVGPTSQFVAGMAFDEEGRVHITTTANPTDVWIAGWRLSATGQLVVDDGLPGNQPYVSNGGFPFSKVDGRLIRQDSQTPAPSDPFVVGIRIGPLGGVYTIPDVVVPPEIISAPVINGSVFVDTVVTYTPGSADGGSSVTARSWKVDGVEVGTGLTYTPVVGNTHGTLTITETWTNAGGSTPNASSGVTVVNFDPQLTYNFMSGLLPSGLALTRASVGSVINAAGTLVSAAINEPRFDHTLAGVLRGMLIEPASENLVLRSVVPAGNTGWNAINQGTATGTLTANYATAPDGTNTAARFQSSANGGTTTADTTIIQSAGSVNPIDVPLVCSAWIRSNTGADQTIRATIGGGGALLLTVTPQWQRFEWYVTASSTTGAFWRIAMRASDTSTEVDVSFWGAQYEVRSDATSYIPTSGATATRAADQVVATGGTFAAAYNGQASTVRVNLETGANTGNISTYSQLGDAAGYRQSALRTRASGIIIDLADVPGSNFNIFTQALNNRQLTMVGGFNQSIRRGCAQGQAVSETSGDSTPATTDRLVIGATTDFLQAQPGWYRSVNYWASLLNAGDMQTWSAG